MSVSVDKQMWVLSDTIDVENPASFLASGAYGVNANTWYNLSLSVVGTTVNAWIGQDQVCGIADCRTAFLIILDCRLLGGFR